MAKKQIATFLAPNKGLSTLGNHAYGYSGEIEVDQTSPEFFNFTTGDTYLVGEMQINYYDIAGDDDMRYEIKFNGNLVMSYYVEYANRYSSPDNVIPLIIPPRTAVIVTGYNDNSTNGRKNIASIVGRIYNA